MRRGKLKPKRAGDSRAGSTASIVARLFAVSAWYLTCTEHRNSILLLLLFVSFLLQSDS